MGDIRDHVPPVQILGGRVPPVPCGSTPLVDTVQQQQQQQQRSGLQWRRTVRSRAADESKDLRRRRRRLRRACRRDDVTGCIAAAALSQEAGREIVAQPARSAIVNYRRAVREISHRCRRKEAAAGRPADRPAARASCSQAGRQVSRSVGRLSNDDDIDASLVVVVSPSSRLQQLFRSHPPPYSRCVYASQLSRVSFLTTSHDICIGKLQ